MISKNIEKAKGYGLITSHYCGGITIFYTEVVGNCLVLLICHPYTKNIATLLFNGCC
jgi:hypothetical protein